MIASDQITVRSLFTFDQPHLFSPVMNDEIEAVNHGIHLGAHVDEDVAGECWFGLLRVEGVHATGIHHGVHQTEQTHNVQDYSDDVVDELQLKESQLLLLEYLV